MHYIIKYMRKILFLIIMLISGLMLQAEELVFKDRFDDSLRDPLSHSL